MSDDPACPGVTLYLYQPARLWSLSGGVWIVRSWLRPTSVTGAFTPMAGMTTRTGADQARALIPIGLAWGGTEAETPRGTVVEPSGAGIRRIACVATPASTSPAMISTTARPNISLLRPFIPVSQRTAGGLTCRIAARLRGTMVSTATPASTRTNAAISSQPTLPHVSVAMAPVPRVPAPIPPIGGLYAIGFLLSLFGGL